MYYYYGRQWWRRSHKRVNISASSWKRDDRDEVKWRGKYYHEEEKCVCLHAQRICYIIVIIIIIMNGGNIVFGSIL